MCDFVVRVAEECAAGAAPDEECPPVVVSWEGTADIQSGDILIVRISDSLLLDTFKPKNATATVALPDANNTSDRYTLHYYYYYTALA